MRQNGSLWHKIAGVDVLDIEVDNSGVRWEEEDDSRTIRNTLPRTEHSVLDVSRTPVNSS